MPSNGVVMEINTLSAWSRPIRYLFNICTKITHDAIGYVSSLVHVVTHPFSLLKLIFSNPIHPWRGAKVEIIAPPKKVQTPPVEIETPVEEIPHVTTAHKIRKLKPIDQVTPSQASNSKLWQLIDKVRPIVKPALYTLGFIAITGSLLAYYCQNVAEPLEPCWLPCDPPPLEPCWLPCDPLLPKTEPLTSDSSFIETVNNIINNTLDTCSLNEFVEDPKTVLESALTIYNPINSALNKTLEICSINEFVKSIQNATNSSLTIYNPISSTLHNTMKPNQDLDGRFDWKAAGTNLLAVIGLYKIAEGFWSLRTVKNESPGYLEKEITTTTTSQLPVKTSTNDSSNDAEKPSTTEAKNRRLRRQQEQLKTQLREQIATCNVIKLEKAKLNKELTEQMVKNVQQAQRLRTALEEQKRVEQLLSQKTNEYELLGQELGNTSTLLELTVKSLEETLHKQSKSQEEIHALLDTIESLEKLDGMNKEAILKLINKNLEASKKYKSLEALKEEYHQLYEESSPRIAEDRSLIHELNSCFYFSIEYAANELLTKFGNHELTIAQCRSKLQSLLSSDSLAGHLPHAMRQGAVPIFTSIVEVLTPNSAPKRELNEEVDLIRSPQEIENLMRQLIVAYRQNFISLNDFKYKIQTLKEKIDLNTMILHEEVNSIGKRHYTFCSSEHIEQLVRQLIVAYRQNFISLDNFESKIETLKENIDVELMIRQNSSIAHIFAEAKQYVIRESLLGRIQTAIGLISPESFWVNSSSTQITIVRTLKGLISKAKDFIKPDSSDEEFLDKKAVELEVVLEEVMNQYFKTPESVPFSQDILASLSELDEDSSTSELDHIPLPSEESLPETETTSNHTNEKFNFEKAIQAGQKKINPSENNIEISIDEWSRSSKVKKTDSPAVRKETEFHLKRQAFKKEQTGAINPLKDLLQDFIYSQGTQDKTTIVNSFRQLHAQIKQESPNDLEAITQWCKQYIVDSAKARRDKLYIESYKRRIDFLALIHSQNLQPFDALMKSLESNHVSQVILRRIDNYINDEKTSDDKIQEVLESTLKSCDVESESITKLCSLISHLRRTHKSLKELKDARQTKQDSYRSTKAALRKTRENLRNQIKPINFTAFAKFKPFQTATPSRQLDTLIEARKAQGTPKQTEKETTFATKVEQLITSSKQKPAPYHVWSELIYKLSSELQHINQGLEDDGTVENLKNFISMQLSNAPAKKQEAVQRYLEQLETSVKDVVIADKQLELTKQEKLSETTLRLAESTQQLQKEKLDLYNLEMREDELVDSLKEASDIAQEKIQLFTTLTDELDGGKAKMTETKDAALKLEGELKELNGLVDHYQEVMKEKEEIRTFEQAFVHLQEYLVLREITESTIGMEERTAQEFIDALDALDTLIKNLPEISQSSDKAYTELREAYDKLQKSYSLVEKIEEAITNKQNAIKGLQQKVDTYKTAKADIEETFVAKAIEARSQALGKQQNARKALVKHLKEYNTQGSEDCNQQTPDRTPSKTPIRSPMLKNTPIPGSYEEKLAILRSPARPTPKRTPLAPINSPATTTTTTSFSSPTTSKRFLSFNQLLGQENAYGVSPGHVSRKRRNFLPMTPSSPTRFPTGIKG